MLNLRGGDNNVSYFALETSIVALICIEEFDDHPLNGPLAGRRRNGRQSFWKCPTSLLRATAPESSGLSRCVDYTYRPVHPICMGLFANRAGGRVCVAGYYPWEQLQTGSKATQLKGVMRWLSGDRLPAWVASFHRINLWVRGPQAPARGTPATTPWAIALLNACLDPAEDVELLVRTARDRLCLHDPRGGHATVAGATADGPYRRFRLPRIEPWTLVLATV